MAWSLTRLKALLMTTPTEQTQEPLEVALGKNAPIEPACPEVMLISVIGLEAPERDRMLDWMIDDCAASGKVPVFITDELDLGPWLTRELVVEHLPSMERQGRMASDLDWDLYLKRRLDFLKRKWRTNTIVDLGRSLDRLGQAQRTPPIDIDAARRAAGIR